MDPVGCGSIGSEKVYIYMWDRGLVCVARSVAEVSVKWGGIGMHVTSFALRRQVRASDVRRRG